MPITIKVSVFARGPGSKPRSCHSKDLKNPT